MNTPFSYLDKISLLSKSHGPNKIFPNFFDYIFFRMTAKSILRGNYVVKSSILIYQFEDKNDKLLEKK